MQSYLGELFLFFFWIYCVISLLILGFVVWKVRGRWGKVIGGVVVMALSMGWPVYFYLKARFDDEKSIKEMAFVKASFEKRCADKARMTIKKTIENVEGVFVMKPRREATHEELQDQYWMGDPYGYSSWEAKFPHALLVDQVSRQEDPARARTLSGFRFIEMPNPERERNATAPEYVRLTWGGSVDSGRNPIVERVATAKLASKYGFDWDDISTREDRALWIAGGRMRIYELATMDVLAERVGYLLDPMQGGRVGADTWQFSNTIACPSFAESRYKAFDFLRKVLKPLKESVHVK